MDFLNEIKSRRDKEREIKQRDIEAKVYENNFICEYQHKIERSVYLRELSPDEDELILDAGCGTGRFTEEIAKKGAKIIAIDYSLESLKICKTRCEKLKVRPFLIRADLCDIPLKPKIVDKILFAVVFEHIPTKEDRKKALVNLYRTLKPGGRLVISSYNYDLLYRLRNKKEGYHPGGIYYYNHTLPEFRDILSMIFDRTDKLKVFGILNFIWCPCYIQKKLSKIYKVLKKMKVLYILESVDRIIERTPLSYFTGCLLCANVTKKRK
jgi:ubiquinone/menaquinone biosynthesis C-methylase UbiE